MSWMATERFGARTAPDGLAVVQELVNTHETARDGVDLLADRRTAASWLRTAAARWAECYGLQAPDADVDEADLRTLRELRERVNELLAVAPAERPTTPFDASGGTTPGARTSLVVDAHGRVAVVPEGTGAAWLAGAVWTELLLAQHSGALAHLKLCREAGCRTAFYDASRNGSAVWHNVRSCGNMANLRASRARRKGHDGSQCAGGGGDSPVTGDRARS